MATAKEEDIKVRVPGAIKAALGNLADARFTTISEIARQALLDYLARHNYSVEVLREAADAPKSHPPAAPATYRKGKRAGKKSVNSVSDEEDSARKLSDIIRRPDKDSSEGKKLQ